MRRIHKVTEKCGRLASASLSRQALGWGAGGHWILAALLLCAPLRLLAMPYGVYDPRAAAMGGAAVALSDRYAAVQNMALAGRAREFVDWSLSLPSIGWQQMDVNDFAGSLDAYQANPAANKLLGLSDKTSTHHQFSALVATVPSDVFGGGLYLLQDKFRGQRIVVDASDPTRVQVNSYVEKRAMDVTEHGVGFAQYRLSLLGLIDNVVVGFVPKLLLVSSTLYREPISSASSNVVLTASEANDNSAFNVDVGVLKEFSRFTTLGFAVRNLLPMSFRYISDGSERVVVNPQARVGLAYERKERTFVVDVDLTSNPEVAFVGRSRYAAFGGEVAVGDHLSLRAGMKVNLVGEQELVFTGGGGIDIGGHRLDVAIENGRGVTGASAHLNIQF